MWMQSTLAVYLSIFQEDILPWFNRTNMPSFPYKITINDKFYGHHIFSLGSNLNKPAKYSSVRNLLSKVSAAMGWKSGGEHTMCICVMDH
jgi:hypothetical protein